MKCFTLRLQDASRVEEITGVSSFVGEDSTGSFGILAGHTRMMASLITGLARFRRDGGEATYLAMPGALLYFNDNLLTLTTRHYFLDTDYMRIIDTLEQQLLAEEAALESMKTSLHQMEEEVLKRLWEMGRGTSG
jgi:F-type H+-transporting ATPase subunit epsilon